MNRYFKALFSALLVCAFIVSLGCSAYAETYQGNGKLDVDSSNELQTSTKLFADLKGAMPGDTMEQKIVITNDSADSDYVNVYLRAKAYDNTDETVNFDDVVDFIHQIDLTIKTQVIPASGKKARIAQEYTTVYDSLPYSADSEYRHGIHNDILLGTLYKGETLNVDAVLSVPISLGNEYSAMSGDVQWVITIQEANDPNASLRNTSFPKTGDDSQLLLWAAVLSLSAAALCAAAVTLYRKRSQFP
jgi:hypothetical protein